MCKLSGFLTLLVADEITAWMPFLLQYVYMSCCCILNMHNGNAYSLYVFYFKIYKEKHNIKCVNNKKILTEKYIFFSCLILNLEWSYLCFTVIFNLYLMCEMPERNA